MLIPKDVVNRGIVAQLGYVRMVEIAELGDAGVLDASVSPLDHGRQVILEP